VWFKKQWELSRIAICMRFKGKMSYIWDLKNKMSFYMHIKFKLHTYALLALKSHIWHALNYRYVDLYFPDAVRSPDLVRSLQSILHGSCLLFDRSHELDVEMSILRSYDTATHWNRLQHTSAHCKIDLSTPSVYTHCTTQTQPRSQHYLASKLALLSHTVSFNQPQRVRVRP